MNDSSPLSYSFWVACGVIAAWAIRKKEAERLSYHRHPRYIWVLLGCLVGAVVGAKVGMLMYMKSGNWLSMVGGLLNFRFDGKTILGALAGGYVFGEITKKIVGIEFSTGDALAIALPVGQAFGRMGCLFGGCCQGVATTLPWAVEHQGVLTHPTPLYEAVGCLLLAAVLWKLRLRLKTPGRLFLLYLFFYAALRFLLESFRGDAQWLSMGLSAGQVFCLGLMAFATIRFFQMKSGTPVFAPQQFPE